LCKVHLKDAEGTNKDFTAAIQLNSENGNGYYNKGLMKIALKQKESGCDDFSKAGEMGIGESLRCNKEIL